MLRKSWRGLGSAFVIALTAFTVVGCGGGGGTMSAASSVAPVLKVDGWQQPAGVGQQQSLHIRMRSSLQGNAPVPARIALGPLAQEKLAQESLSGPRLVGVARTSPKTQSGTAVGGLLKWHEGAHGNAVAAISYSAEGAHGLRLGVLVESLPGSAALRVYSQEKPEVVFQISGQEILQRIQANVKAGDITDAARTWWTPDMGTQEATLEIELPAGTPKDALRIAIPSVSHIFADLSVPTEEEMQAKINESQACEQDATCDDSYANQRNAVARMVFTSNGLSYLCTGTLLNDGRSTGTPYFLTANHCISSQTVASTLQTDWFYRSPTCNSRTLSSTSTKRYNGGQLLYNSSSNDVSFLKLNDDAPAGAYFAGWDATKQGISASVVGLHHPAGDLLKLSQGQITSFLACTPGSGNTFQCSNAGEQTGNFYRINWVRGTTEGGSSGSALFKGGTHVIGTLYGGSSSCTSSAYPEVYGRFDLAYEAGLKEWLSTTAPAGNRNPVYRFYNNKTGAHFFTPSQEERDSVIKNLPDFTYENVAFYAYPAASAGESPVFRFFNTQKNAHFYTINVTERDAIQANYSFYRYEGPVWYAQVSAVTGSTPIYRFFRKSTETHFYTISSSERDGIIANYPDFRYEGVAYHAWTTAQ